jgi:hypothetical protein
VIAINKSYSFLLLLQDESVRPEEDVVLCEHVRDVGLQLQLVVGLVDVKRRLTFQPHDARRQRRNQNKNDRHRLKEEEETDIYS